MSEELKPGAETTPDVLENAMTEATENKVENVASEQEIENEQVADYSDMTLAELSQLFEKLAGSDDRMAKSKEAEAIKAAFYKKLSKERHLPVWKFLKKTLLKMQQKRMSSRSLNLRMKKRH